MCTSLNVQRLNRLAVILYEGKGSVRLVEVKCIGTILRVVVLSVAKSHGKPNLMVNGDLLQRIKLTMTIHNHNHKITTTNSTLN